LNGLCGGNFLKVSTRKDLQGGWFRKEGSHFLGGPGKHYWNGPAEPAPKKKKVEKQATLTKCSLIWIVKKEESRKRVKKEKKAKSGWCWEKSQ